MVYASLLLVGGTVCLCWSIATAHIRDSKCGSREPTENERKLSNDLVDQHLHRLIGRRGTFPWLGIPVQFHIIHALSGYGRLRMEAIEAQLNVLNNAYEKSQIKFFIKNVQYIQGKHQ